MIQHDPACQKELSPNAKKLSFHELKSLVKSWRILFHCFRYREAALLTYDLSLLSKPLLLALTLKGLSFRKAYWSDRKGNYQTITIRLLGALFLQWAQDFLQKKSFLKSMVQTLETFPKRPRQTQLDLSRRPVYLRTDFCFGLQSGGSIGHIAGVLNHLALAPRQPPLFLTNDPIPTTSSNIETYIIRPERRFWDFIELSSFAFNATFFKKAVEYIGENSPSFIYQRYSLNNFSGVELSQRYRVPLVLEYNGSEVWVSRNWGGALKYEKLSQNIERQNLHSANLIVVVSQPLKDELTTLGIESSKILVNPNGVNPEIYSPSVNGSRIREKIGSTIVLGFIGTFGKWHGAEVLVDSFGQLLQENPGYKKNVKLFMIGDGLTMPLVKKKAAEWNLSESVIFTGTVPQDQGPLYLAACDILVSPHVPNRDGSAFFGSPTKLFEYMAMGKGIVASSLNQISEILRHDDSAWMVTPGDSKSLKNGLKTLIEDPAKRERLGRTARQEVLRHHTWSSHTQKILDRLQDLYT